MPQGLRLCGKDLEQDLHQMVMFGWHTYQGHSWLCPIFAHRGGKSQGLCCRHGRHHAQEDTQHSFYPLQSNMKILREKTHSLEGQQNLSRSASQHMRSSGSQAFMQINTELRASEDFLSRKQ